MKQIKNFLSLIFTTLTLTVSSIVWAQLPDDIDEVIEKIRQDMEVTGLSVSIVKDNEVIYAKGFGLRELGKPERVDENTLFAIGSNAKAFTSASLGVLVDEGKLSWDDKVTKHLPWFELFDPYVTREITIRDILSHRSGLGRRGDLNWYATDFSREEVVRRIRHLEPNAGFRTEMGYQNTMFIAAGLVDAAISGHSWDESIQKRIFDPLGMERSGTSVRDFSNDNNVASPHQKFGDEIKVIPYRNIDNAGPAGSINSSALEMTKWMRLILNKGEFEGNRVLSEAVINEVHMPHVSIPISGAFKLLRPSANFMSYGLGWLLNDYKGSLMASHTGGIDGMLSEIALVPQHGLGIMVLTNTSVGGTTSAIISTILDAFFEEESKDWGATFLAFKNQGEEAQKAQLIAFEDNRVKDTNPSLSNISYVGKYSNEMYGDVFVTEEDGTLIIRRHTKYVGELKHYHFDTFYAQWKDLSMSSPPGTAVDFSIGVDGKVKSLNIEGAGDFEKVS